MRAPLVTCLCLAAACSRGHLDYPGSDDRIGPANTELALAKHELTPAEHAVFDKQGFAILGAGEANSFHVGYTALFHAHQPVYVTADSLLHAWHSSYDHILIQVERDDLIPRVTAMLTALRARLAATPAGAPGRADVDVYLGAALAMITNKPAAPVAGGSAAEIAELAGHATSATGGEAALFGKAMKFDWSMCKPRGHYDGYPELEAYFRAMMFLGRIEIRIANQDDRHEWHVDHRAFAGAQLLASLFDPKLRDSWQHIDDTLGLFVGPPDSMSLPGLAAGIAALPAGTPTDAQIAGAFHDRARQKIQTQLVLQSDSAIAFVLFGQRFVLDSKVFSDLTYDALETTPPRLMPTPLDVGHAVFRNPAARELLDAQVARYGKPYEDALAAERKDVDRDPTLGGTSLYHLWLGALRGLSPDQDTALPAPLTGTAWARRMLSAQLASWAELRHDTLLYAKQSVTVELGCEYPDGYVDPYPAFYQAMVALAKRGKALGGQRVVAYFEKMEQVMTRLGAMAERERKNQPLTDDDLDYLNHMVSVVGRDGGCTTTYEPEGWYADLYFDRGQAMFHEPVIADVHTQPTDEAGNPVGRVLHVGTGMPHMMVVKLEHDGGEHRQTYRGFVSTYRELVTENYERLTDQEWRNRKDPNRTSVPAWLDPITTE